MIIILQSLTMTAALSGCRPVVSGCSGEQQHSSVAAAGDSLATLATDVRVAQQRAPAGL